MVHKRKHRSIKQSDIWNSYLVGFFDDVVISNKCGSEAFIALDCGQYYHFYSNIGTGTNSQVEVNTLWGVLFCVKWLSLESLDVFGDTKVVIEWVNERSTLNPPMLSNWMSRIRELIGQFILVTFTHIYKEMNKTTNTLSKKGHE